MSTYFVGIDISKYKHDCCIINAADQSIVAKFTIQNDKDGFNELLTSLQSLSTPDDIKIGFESTAHYALNLELFLEKAHHSFMEVNYKPHSKGFYHAYSLKSLTRLRDRLIRQRSFYLVKITNVLDHTFPEFKPFFQERFSKTALYLLENYGSAEKMAHMNSASYDNLRRISRGKFTPQKFLELKALATNTVGVNNSIFDTELTCLLTLYKEAAKQISVLETQITGLIEEVHPHYMSIPGIGSISAAVIYAEYGDISNFSSPAQMLAFAGFEYGDISNFSSPAQMLAFAGLEPGISESGTESHKGRMVKRGSSQLRYTLMNCALPLIRFDVTFATYYTKKRSEGKPHRVAISHVTKKLVRVIFALERQNTDFVATALH